MKSKRALVFACLIAVLFFGAAVSDRSQVYSLKAGETMELQRKQP